MRIVNLGLCAALALLSCGALRAQNLPTLGKASEIVTGSLPDHISYYLVNNTNTPGFADFALVQQQRSDRVSPREDLTSLPHFFGRKPYEFLGDNAVGYSRRGFIEHTQTATIFRFTDVPVSRPEVTDSTLLMLFDIARSSEYEQAIVVSGNIDVPAVIERIRILSMTISRRKPVHNAFAYEWKHQDKAVITTTTMPVGYVSAIYRSPRTERELMNTIQPVMSHLLASEFDIVLQRRLRAAFDKAKLPLADYRYRYTGSDSTAGDELVSVSLLTDSDKLEEAVRVFAGVLATLDEDGATQDEVAFARTVIAENIMRDNLSHKPTNEEYLNKCIGSYLYGSNLATEATLSKVFTGRRLDVGRETELLNRYIAAVLSPSRNLHLRTGAPVAPDAEHMRAVFTEAWKGGYAVEPVLPSAADTASLSVPRRKVKLKTTAKDTFTGGKLWTFSNGVSVIYKKTADAGSFHYGFMLKGGWSEISGIQGSEPAFVQDVLSLGKVGGLTASQLKDLLSLYGITFQPSITMSDVRFTGAAPSSSLSLVLKTMVGVANRYEPDPEAYDRYLKEVPVWLIRDKFADKGTRAVLDSTMCPGYAFAAGSLPDLPGDDLYLRMSNYMIQKGGNIKNAVIVLVGDLDENIALKILTQTLGAFRTGQQRVMRPKMAYPLRSCWTTNVVRHNWRSRSVNVALSALWPFGPDGYSQMSLACTVLQAELDRALMADGMYCSVTGSSDMLPAEKMTIHIHCEPIPSAGLPSDVSAAMPIQSLSTVRSVINRLATSEIDSEELEHCKTMLTNRFKAEEGSTALLRDAVLDRGSVGQDVRGGYALRIKAVSASELRKLFSTLSGCNAEYIVQ